MGAAAETLSPALVVDDDSANLRLMTLTLGLSGFEPVTARTGAEAEEVLAAGVPDVALIDLALPDLEGTELVRRIRSRSDTRELPLLVVSASARREDVEAALAAGCDRFLPKPINTRTLGDQVLEVIESRRESDS